MRAGRFPCVPALAAVLMLSACGLANEPDAADVEAPVDGPAAGPEAITPRNPFFGAWSMTAAKIAPWWDGKGEEPAPDPAFAAKVELGANKTSGPPILMCDNPHYTVNTVQPQTLFEGNLPDPANDAAALGFKPDGIVTLNFTCASGAGDVSLDFPMVDPSTIMLGLDNVLYTFRFVDG